MSMGATRSWWLMALDERIQTGVAIACLTRYQNLIEHEMLKAHGIYYFVPGLLNHFDTEAVVALIAPRPALFQNGGADDGSPEDGIHAIEAAVRPAYKLYGNGTTSKASCIPGRGMFIRKRCGGKRCNGWSSTSTREGANLEPRRIKSKGEAAADRTESLLVPLTKELANLPASHDVRGTQVHRGQPERRPPPRMPPGVPPWFQGSIKIVSRSFQGASSALPPSAPDGGPGSPRRSPASIREPHSGLQATTL